ncbi:phosphotransferase enzyme family protein [Photobacterium galatheae]|nr:phosphotransferase [Photobacterium galatheae]MCM0149819.1 phosphotransferase [Photobacterium galatheae]
MDRKKAALYKRLREHWSQFEHEATIVENTLGATNQVFRVNTEPAFYLRKYRTNEITRVQNEHELLLQLSQNLDFVVSPFLTRHKSTFTKIGSHLYALFPEANWQLINQDALSESHAFQAGKTLAELHRHLAPFTSDKFPTIELSWDKCAWVQRLQKVITTIESNGIEHTTDEWAFRRAQKQMRYLSDIKTTHTYRPKTQRTLIHGDYHHYNLFFDQQSNVCGIIDWDLLQNMPRAYEIARACMYMFKLEKNKTIAFINGYMAVNHITQDQLHDGAKAWGIFADHHVWALEAVYLNRNMSAKKFVPHTDFEPFMHQWLPIENALFGLAHHQ